MFIKQNGQRSMNLNWSKVALPNSARNSLLNKCVYIVLHKDTVPSLAL